MRVCEELGCTNNHNARGLCTTHYMQRKKAGTLSERKILDRVSSKMQVLTITQGLRELGS